MRGNLIEVAAALLAEQGVAGLTAEEVARRADVALQTVYNRVGGKSALLAATTELALEENRRFVDAAYASKGTPTERIERAGAAYVRFALERPHQFHVMSNPPDDPEAMGRVVSLIHEQTSRLGVAVREAMECGEVAPGVDPNVTAVAIWAMLNGVLNLVVRTDALRLEEAAKSLVINTAISVIRGGLKTPSAGVSAI
ncbi:TetR/AcrR family transcriptional regulator [Pseudomonas aeruginosa]|uniref:TetR/AcrR family transcriptional regulator n=1 Tax=Pseudomonas aeruginosa TaxID=287 RepID=UPI0015BEE606|nr:TetR/AcrR family transcriptional regulator [Pseudomonas aeruginosa]